ncbi:hypothetical protein ACYFX5_08880 [Bremerella sp. T1]|uniref:hypothetical protein n=1 Tax=Bremerella sp. TYQ1 TaxID=3119568 RepID=UPI001CCE071D|nr:hypothetical protein [Bremerella volcania]UBM38368.1 hypothetical protein LA756_10810 [Bremerella volcania]
MCHRRIVRSQAGWVVKESGTGRILAEVPIDPVWEHLEPAERTAKELRNYPKLMDFVRHRAFHGDDETKRILKELA